MVHWSSLTTAIVSTLSDDITEAVDKVLDNGIFPIYHTCDDRGLDRDEYIDFVREVISELDISDIPDPEPA